MSVEPNGLQSSSETSHEHMLTQLMQTELVSIPVEQWGFFFPLHVAVWRFIEAKRPGTLGPLKATFREEPYFHGKGATWFTSALGGRDDYLDLLEAIMYPITRNTPAELRERVRARGFFLDSEIPPLDVTLIRRLANIVLREVDSAIESHIGL